VSAPQVDDRVDDPVDAEAAEQPADRPAGRAEQRAREHDDGPHDDGPHDDGADLLDRIDDLRIDDDHDGDPVLLRADGSPVQTWREGYPYRERLPREEYERDKRLLQIELLKLQYWTKDTGQRIVVLFEGRDAAGKGGTIKRFTEHLDPRGVRVVTLEKPTEREATQWYFQRYVAHLPAAGEIVLFDRSWYNRAGVERVMGFAEPREYLEFLRETPDLERMLVRSGIHLVKLWFSVSRAEQRTRFVIRRVDPVRRWKLSPMDLESMDRWHEYTEAKEAMFFYTDTADAPWTVIKSNDKKRARLAAMRFVLGRFDYPDKDLEVVGESDPRIVVSAASIFEEDQQQGR
jgi:polyphosphate kinase 2